LQPPSIPSKPAKGTSLPAAVLGLLASMSETLERGQRLQCRGPNGAGYVRIVCDPMVVCVLRCDGQECNAAGRIPGRSPFPQGAACKHLRVNHIVWRALRVGDDLIENGSKLHFVLVA